MTIKHLMNIVSIALVFILIPVVNALTELLWVTACDDSKTEWDNMVNNPYLNDDDNNWIHEISGASQEAGDFSFNNTVTCSGNTITSTFIFFETQAEDAPNNDGYDVYLNTGGGFGSIGWLQPSTQGSYVWDNINASATLDTSTKLDDVTMYLDTHNLGGGDDIYVRGAYLNVTCEEVTVDTIFPNVTLNFPTDDSTETNTTVTFNCTPKDDTNLSNVTLYYNSTAGASSIAMVQNSTNAHEYNAGWYNLTLTLPSAATINNLIITAISIDKDSGIITTPDGFTLIKSANGSASSGAMAFKIATGDETEANWSWSSLEEGTGWIGEFSGLAISDVLDNSTENTSFITAGNVDACSHSINPITTNQADELAIIMYVSDSGNSVGSIQNFSDGFSSIIDYTDPITGSGSPFIHIGQKTLTSIGTVSTTHSHNDVDCNQDESYTVLATFNADLGAWSAKETKSISGTENETTFVKNLTDGATYVWNCLACDTTNNCNFSISNYTFNISVPSDVDIFPNVTLDTPLNNSNQTDIEVTFECTSRDDLNLSNVSLYFNSNSEGSISNTIWSEDFESGWSTPEPIGNHADWYSVTPHPTITDNVGVDNSVGIAPGQYIFIWSGKSFNWTDPSTEGVIMKMDFEPDGSGDMNDDRVGWHTYPENESSSNIFGVHVEPTAITGYWDGVTNPDQRPVFTSVPALPTGVWYRLIVNITKLTNTSVSINATLWNLTTSGALHTIISTGNISDTDNLADPPNTKYFTDAYKYPSYKNYNTITGDADNAYFEVINGSGNGGISWHLNETINISGTSNITTFTKNLTDNLTYEWNCYACDTANQCEFATANYTFKLNTSATGVCDCPANDNCTILCSNNCTITTNYARKDYSLIINGDNGYFHNKANLTFNNVMIDGRCQYIDTPNDGNKLIIDER